jgi:hypothetical protein
MSKIKPFSYLLLVVGTFILTIGLWFLFDMTHYKEVQDFNIMKLISKGIAFSVGGGLLILIGFILKGTINKAIEELQDLKNEVHSLRKEVEYLKK